MIQFIIRLLLPLTVHQFIDRVSEEVCLGLVNETKLLSDVKQKVVFNNIYEPQLVEIYSQADLFDLFLSRIESPAWCPDL